MIFRLAKYFLEQTWQNEGVFQCQITALDPQIGRGQLDLFENEEDPRAAINEVMDEINQQFGRESLTSATRLKRLEMPDIISPAWRPEGHRATVVGVKE